MIYWIIVIGLLLLNVASDLLNEYRRYRANKEKYCPQCYFEDDVKILRKDCKHNIK